MNVKRLELKRQFLPNPGRAVWHACLDIVSEFWCLHFEERIGLCGRDCWASWQSARNIVGRVSGWDMEERSCSWFAIWTSQAARVGNRRVQVRAPIGIF